MRLKLTLILLLLNVLLFGGLFYLDKHSDAQRGLDSQSTLVLPSGLVEDASTVELRGPAVRNGWRLEHAQGGWRLVQPVEWPANRFAVESILNQLRFMRWETRFPVADVETSGRTLADYGLETPSVVLEIHHAGQDTVLRMGAPTQIGNRLYLLSPGGDEIYVVPRDLLRAVMLDLQDLRSAAVFALPPYQVRSLAVQREGGARARLVRRGEGWEFESPVRVAANRGAVESLFTELLGLDVQEFVQPDLAQQGLLSPRVRVTVEGVDTRQTLLLGSASPVEGRVYARLEDSPEVFTVDTAILDRLLDVQEALRERRFNQFDTAALTEVRIAMGDKSAVLQKLETGDWQVMRGDGADGVQTWAADVDVMKRLITQLADLHAIRFVSDAPSSADLANYGFGNPQRRVTLKTGGQTRVLLLGDMLPGPRTVYARLEADPFVYEVPGEILNILRPTPLHYRSRELESLPAAARVDSLRLLDLETGAPVIDLAAAAGGWGPVIKDLPADNATALLALVDFIRAGRARDFLAARYADPMPLDAEDSLPWRYRLEARVSLPAGTGANTQRDIVYDLTARVGGTTQFGGSEARGLLFTLPQDLIDALHELTYTRPAPTLPELAAPETPVEDAAPSPTDVPPAE